ncbi:Type III secretion ATP synthase HrcN [compost metagenome]
MNEPVADHMRAILDGHIVLSRSVATRGHWPAIDVLHSISRLAGTLHTQDQKGQVERLRSALGSYQNSVDLIELGAYEKGSQPLLDTMIDLKPEFDALLRQTPQEHFPSSGTWKTVLQLVQRLGKGVSDAK